MFGYVIADIPNVFIKDTVLYRATYCGLCKGINKACGNKGRFTLSYDLTFLSLFTHNICGLDLEINKENCILHPIKKRPIAKVDALTERIGALNVILAYYKLTDDMLDEKKGGLKRSFFKSSFKKAAKKEPKLKEIVKNSYQALRKLEKEGSTSVDIVSDSFATMMREIVKELLADKSSESVEKVAYSLGKWVYLIDALDDYDKDKKEGNYNVFVKAFGDFANRSLFIEKHLSDIENIFGEIFYDIYENGQKIKYCFNHDFIDNVLYSGLRVQTKCVLGGKKCANTMKF